MSREPTDRAPAPGSYSIALPEKVVDVKMLEDGTVIAVLEGGGTVELNGLLEPNRHDQASQ